MPVIMPDTVPDYNLLESTGYWIISAKLANLSAGCSAGSRYGRNSTDPHLMRGLRDGAPPDHLRAIRIFIGFWLTNVQLTV